MAVIRIDTIFTAEQNDKGSNHQTGHKKGFGRLGFLEMAVSASSAVHLHAVACASGCRGAGASGLFPVRSLGSTSRDFVGGGRLAVVGGRTVSTSSCSSSRRGGGPVAVRGALFPFLQKKDKEKVKQELLDAIAPLERGAEATEEDIARVEKVLP